MSRIQEVVVAQVFSAADERQLQMLVYREGCDGKLDVLTIQQQALVELLNREGM